ncbi:uncharacterized protein TrAFT101_010976 [Trichoderma asperellum]|uniref:uncharacterized protein n=1 Tax=Trichoderma asperellum TaxID=101201 RepID=UPI00331A78A2|nr:hypothetical protein TrAFT101_010976 [Trichoderma asperellum]
MYRCSKEQANKWLTWQCISNQAIDQVPARLPDFACGSSRRHTSLISYQSNRRPSLFAYYWVYREQDQVHIK